MNDVTTEPVIRTEQELAFELNTIMKNIHRGKLFSKYSITTYKHPEDTHAYAHIRIEDGLSSAYRIHVTEDNKGKLVIYGSASTRKVEELYFPFNKTYLFYTLWRTAISRANPTVPRSTNEPEVKE